jgi:hypothetical protein
MIKQSPIPATLENLIELVSRSPRSTLVSDPGQSLLDGDPSSDRYGFTGCRSQLSRQSISSRILDVQGHSGRLLSSYILGKEETSDSPPDRNCVRRCLSVSRITARYD